MREIRNIQVLSKNGQYTIGLRDLFEKVRPGRRKILRDEFRVLGVDVNLAAIPAGDFSEVI